MCTCTIKEYNTQNILGEKFNGFLELSRLRVIKLNFTFVSKV